MDAHPVPQNITSFQFRLIGDMTLKQFGYLGSGVGLAYLMFIVLAPIAPIIAFPMIVISAFLGVAFAFLPIQDRPLDHWVAAFLKAIYSPTKRAWKKNGKDALHDPNFKNRLNIFVTVRRAMAQPLMSSPLHSISAQPLPQPVAAATPVASGLAKPTGQAPVFTPRPAPAAVAAPVPLPDANIAPPGMLLPHIPVQAPIAPQPVQPAPVAVAPRPVNLPTSDDLTRTVQLGKEAQSLQVKIIETEKQLSQVKTQAALGGVSTKQYTENFNNIFDNLQKLVVEASTIKRELAVLTHEPVVARAQAKVEVVKVKPRPMPELVLTSTPNVISGIVVDNGGNYLEGVVVVIHDKDGLPVRALKTNKLGQFTGSTPLPTGTYNIELEKDGLAFDVLQIELEGKVIPPLKIPAKQIAGTS